MVPHRALEQMLSLVCRDVGDGGEDVGRVCAGPFDAVAVVDALQAWPSKETAVSKPGKGTAVSKPR